MAAYENCRGKLSESGNVLRGCRQLEQFQVTPAGFAGALLWNGKETGVKIEGSLMSCGFMKGQVQRKPAAAYVEHKSQMPIKHVSRDGVEAGDTTLEFTVSACYLKPWPCLRSPAGRTEKRRGPGTESWSKVTLKGKENRGVHKNTHERIAKETRGKARRLWWVMSRQDQL